MSNGLELFNQILFLNLRPWMQGQVSEQKYLDLSQAVSKEHYQFQPLHKVDFPKPLNDKRKYYSSLIENEAKKFLNATYTVIENANQRGKKYWLNDTINKKVKPKLKEIQKVIEDHGFTLEAIKTSTTVKDYESLRDNSFVIQLLKFNLIHIYLEFQNRYAYLLNEEPLNETEVRQHYFSEVDIEILVLTKADPVAMPNQYVQIEIVPHAKPLPVVKTDFRPGKNGVLSYEVMIKNPDRFASFEEELFGHGLIDVQRNFPNKYGQLQELAAVYHTLIRKGYFNRRNFEKKKNITPLDVRKFLDHRYKAEVFKQFNTWKNNPDGLAVFIENQFWLSHLPTC